MVDTNWLVIVIIIIIIIIIIIMMMMIIIKIVRFVRLWQNYKNYLVGSMFSDINSKNLRKNACVSSTKSWFKTFDDHVAAVYVAFDSVLLFDFRVKVTLPSKNLNSAIMRLYNVVPNTLRIWFKFGKFYCT